MGGGVTNFSLHKSSIDVYGEFVSHHHVITDTACIDSMKMAKEQYHFVFRIILE